MRRSDLLETLVAVAAEEVLAATAAGAAPPSPQIDRGAFSSVTVLVAVVGAALRIQAVAALYARMKSPFLLHKSAATFPIL